MLILQLCFMKKIIFLIRVLSVPSPPPYYPINKKKWKEKEIRDKDSRTPIFRDPVDPDPHVSVDSDPQNIGGSGSTLYRWIRIHIISVDPNPHNIGGSEST